MSTDKQISDYGALATKIKIRGAELGFQQVQISDVDPAEHALHLQRWLEQGYHGNMDYMEKHGDKRAHPDQLLPGTLRVISFRMDYLPPGQPGEHTSQQANTILGQPNKAYISRYALGRDYHKVIRKRLAHIATLIETASSSTNNRAFVDSAPVLERAFAEKAGLGWIGKNTMLINSRAGSWFFLGEILTGVPLPVDPPQTTSHCGTCRACLDICPTNAFTGPWQLDARRCISYLTIELKTSIPEPLRPLMGNRVFGCDDCQLVCPWNKFARTTDETDFRPRHQLDSADLIDLFQWSEADFLNNTEGSAIRRIGYDCWLRNIAVGLGNAPCDEEIIKALQAQCNHSCAMVREHVQWALKQQLTKYEKATH